MDVHAHLIHDKFIGIEDQVALKCRDAGLEYVIVNGLGEDRDVAEIVLVTCIYLFYSTVLHCIQYYKILIGLKLPDLVFFCLICLQIPRRTGLSSTCAVGIPPIFYLLQVQYK